MFDHKPKQPNSQTGLPKKMKSRMEHLSGHSMDDVRVHRNSPRPGGINALAFAQGTNIHLAPGQEKHLPHEAWHVVQQKQGRVKATTQLKGKFNINDEEGLEKEADVMGAKAMQSEPMAALGAAAGGKEGFDFLSVPNSGLSSNVPIQRVLSEDDAKGLRAENLGGRVPSEDEVEVIKPHFDTIADIQAITGLAGIQSWEDVRKLVEAGLPLADIKIFDGLTAGTTVCSVDQMIICHAMRFTAKEIEELCALPQVGEWGHLTRLNDIPGWSAKHITDIAGWSLSQGNTPTLKQMEEASVFSYHELDKLRKGKSWEEIESLVKIHTAPGDENPSPEVLNAMTKVGVNEEKKNVAGVLDKERSCWNWALQGFEDSSVHPDTIYSYFSRRTGFPDLWGPPINHEETVNYLAKTDAGDDPIRVYLNGKKDELQVVIDAWKQARSVNQEDANQAAQLALMRLNLAKSGFTVLPQGTASRWYICMHEGKGNVGFEHWWIKTDVGDVIETFPENARGGGKWIAFHQETINMGDSATDFRHEVPVANLLPEQLEIIKRALKNKKAKISSEIELTFFEKLYVYFFD